MIIKEKPLDIQLRLSNGGRLRIWEEHPYFNANKQIKILDELISQYGKYMKSSSKKDFSMDELNIQLLELIEARQILTNLLVEN